MNNSFVGPYTSKKCCGSKVTAIKEPSNVLAKKATALLLAFVMIISMAGCKSKSDKVPKDVTPLLVLEALKDKEPELRNLLLDTEFTFTNKFREGSEPLNFEEAYAKYAEARQILDENGEDSSALAAANDAIYTMNALILKARGCIAAGLDPNEVIDFTYDGSRWDPCEPKYINLRLQDTTDVKILPGGVEKNETKQKWVKIQMDGDMLNNAINGDTACNRAFVLEDTDRDAHDENLDHAIVAIVRSLCCEETYTAPKSPNGHGELYTGISDDYLELVISFADSYEESMGMTHQRTQ